MTTDLVKNVIIQYHYKYIGWNFINNNTNKVYFATRIIDLSVLKLYPEGKYKQLVVCDKSVIKFGMRKFYWIMQHF